jgi:CheY-like chemotaxis protein
MADPKVMVVEDDRIIAGHIQATLNSLGYSVTALVSSGEEAVKKAERDNPDIVLMDIVLKGEMDGVEAASQIRSRLGTPIVFLTAFSDQKILERAKLTEPFGYLIKPFENRELHSTLEIALYKHKMEKRLKESQEWLSTTLNSIGDAVIASDTLGYVIFMNPVAQELTCWKQDDISGKSVNEVFQIINEKTGEPAENPVIKVRS